MKRLFNKKLYIMLFTLIATFCFAISFLALPKTTYASNEQDDLFLPTTRVEYYDFSSDKPLDAVRFDGGAAIITSNNVNNTLWIYSFTQKKYVNYDRFAINNPIHVKLLDQNTLIVNNNLTLYVIDVSDIDNAEIMPSSSVNAEMFDVSGDYLITRIGNVISVYNSLESDSSSVGNNKAMGNTPVCVNSLGQYFYISKNSSDLVYNSVDAPLAEETTLVPSINPTDMIATNDYLFYVLDGQIYRVSLLDKSVVKLYSESDFDLGKVNNANSISFSGNNLLVSDILLNAVQEFSVDGNSLTFTGFAVAKNKTAFNRVAEGQKQIERLNDLVAVLDSVKLTIIKSNANFDSHDKNCFINRDLESLGNPKSIALGDNNVLLSFTDNTFKLLSLSDATTLTDVLVDIPGEIKDTFYIRNRYYAVYREISGNTIVSFDDNGEDFRIEDNIEGVVSDLLPEKICVDVSGNVYLADNSFVYQNGIQIASRDGFTDFNVDFFGNLFAIKDDKALYFDGNLWQTSYTAQGDIDAFCLNYEKSEVYYTSQGLELIFKTNSFKNTAISSFTLPDSFNTHLEPTNSNFTALTKVQGKFIGAVDISDGIQFDKLSSEQTFALLSDNLLVNTVNGQKRAYLLAGEKSVAICHADAVEVLTIDKTLLTDKVVYVATPVNAYSLPVITDENVYTLLSGEQVLRLNKGVYATVSESFTFLDREYYFGAITGENGEINCFIPSSFTVEVLAEDVKTDKFTYSALKPCDVYLESELSTIILSVDSAKTIRLFSVKNGVASIGVFDQGVLVRGYVDANFINAKPDLTVRNILIILAVLACVCGSTAFFLLRKKK